MGKAWEKFQSISSLQMTRSMGKVSIFIFFFLLWFKYFWIAELDSSQPIKHAMTMLWNWKSWKYLILANQLTVLLHACLDLHVTCPCLETYEYLYWCLFSTYTCRFGWEVWMADSISFLGYPSSLNHPWAIMILFWIWKTHSKHQKLSQILHFLVFQVNQLILLSYFGFPPLCHHT